MRMAFVRWTFAPVLAATLLVGGAARALEQVLRLDPERTTLGFVLGATLHSVQGTLRLEAGEIRFDPAAGQASGEILVDARSADTGSRMRDANMHRDVLESGKFPKIRFRPTRLELKQRSDTRAELVLHGELEIHGASHALALPARLETDPGQAGRLRIASTFRVPYLEWGMRDYSNFVLRVDPFVDVEVRAEGTLAGP